MIKQEKGNTGKSVLAKYLVENYRSIIVSGTTSDSFNVIRDYVNRNGRGPHVIIVDLPRSTETGANFELIEEAKNGMFMSGKYEGGMVTYARPHVVIFANYSPDVSKVSADRWDIAEVSELTEQEMEEAEESDSEESQEYEYGNLLSP